MRYITQQQHDKSCGPIAIMNALKWLGESVSYRKDLELFKQIGYTINSGWYRHELRRGLNYFNIKHKLHKAPTLTAMKQILKKGNSIIMEHDWVLEDTTGGHYIFIDGYEDSFFKAYNTLTLKSESGKISDIYVKQAFYMSKLISKNYTVGRKSVDIWEIGRG